MHPRRVLFLSLALLLHAARHVSAQQSEAARLTAVASQLERDLESVSSHGAKVQKSEQLAVVLQRLNQIAPDGGSHVPRAKQLFEALLADPLIPEPKKMVLHAQMGSLMLMAHEPDASIEAILRSDAIYSRLQATGWAGLDEKMVKGLRQAWHANAVHHMGALRLLGRAQETDDLARRLLTPVVLETNPNLWAKAMSMLAEPTDRDVASIRDALPLLERTAAPYSLGYVHFALYRTLKRDGEYEAAWRHLVQANALQDEAKPVDLDDVLATLNGIFDLDAQPYAPEDPRAQRWRDVVEGKFGYQDATPIFIVGMPRSGSTLVESMLASHPQAVGAGEDTLSSPIAGKLHAHLMNTDFMSDAPERIRDFGKEYVDAMRARVSAQHAGPVLRIVDKMLFNSRNIGMLRMMLPNATFIYMNRHPADTLLSCFAQPFERRGITWANDLQQIAKMTRHTAEVMAFWNRTVPAGHIHRVLYEDVVRFPETTARRLLEACGLDWDPSVLDFVNRGSRRTIATASQLQVRKELYTDSIYAFKPFLPWIGPTLLELDDLIKDYEATAGLAADGWTSVANSTDGWAIPHSDDSDDHDEL